jgi:hypothetical protein
VENRNRTSTFSHASHQLETLTLLCKKQHFLLVPSLEELLYKEHFLISIIKDNFLKRIPLYKRL